MEETSLKLVSDRHYGPMSLGSTLKYVFVLLEPKLNRDFEYAMAMSQHIHLLILHHQDEEFCSIYFYYIVHGSPDSPFGLDDSL